MNATYDSKMLSITDLEKRGFNRELLYRIAHMRNSPMFRCTATGKFYVLENRFYEFISERRCGK